MKRFLSLILAFALMISLLSGCFLIEPFRQHKILSDLPDGDPQNSTPPSVQQDSVEDEPEGILSFTLDQAMIDRFYELLAESEKVAVAGKDLDAAQEAADRLDEVYSQIMNQRQIAYILYCSDQSSQAGKERYLDCVELLSEMETAYNAMCKRVYQSQTPLRKALFADWTQKEIDMLLAYNDEIARLEKRNSEIVLEYRDLEEDDWEENMVVLYNETVRNNNRIAQIYGYENYYAYAYDAVYLRDYGMDSIARLRQYTSVYLSSVIMVAVAQFNTSYEQLSSEQKLWISNLLYDPYNSLDFNYVRLFIQDMPKSSQAAMNEMFEKERALYTDSNNAFAGAFTTMLGDEPFCFFGPEYAATDSVIHELGHYYGISYTDYWEQPMDLSETQSQGNEWMYMYFLRKCSDPQIYQAMLDYKMLTDISYILAFVMIDQFEEQVYSHPNAGNLTLKEYDAIMTQVARDYGGIEMISSHVMDIQHYWKSVVLESPVYYVSYGVSSLASINLFTMAEQDEAAAKEAYRKLMEEPQEGKGFLGNITYAGLEGPFDETVYRKIYSYYIK